VRRVLLAFLVAAVAACASTERYALRSAATYEVGFREIAQSLSAIDWFIVSSDPSTGIITATRSVPGGRTTDRQLRLEILVSTVADRLVVRATFIPPGIAFGTARGEFEELRTAIQARLPDVEAFDG
jgi:hypothetical protein